MIPKRRIIAWMVQFGKIAKFSSTRNFQLYDTLRTDNFFSPKTVLAIANENSNVF